ncbi:hypothetical protein CONPUDRAFT_166261 [Coniophora puteana RWD-64-598 SS2]|uniref:Uncharacterized protein n=1 Tax=Coniophora puteana (strain RWD-64-598) TaxID=741705 RepID=A0A5M3MK96_CONPW|nr:uncharacterized protein CONPUDRAFT_166261 [Coniophora puteana RWD-64-598 SS2]EIW79493.1 hypothetical protein CONPUDRAFT_166261 [Coniophora puteana RWD-64-598 SS2]
MSLPSRNTDSPSSPAHSSVVDAPNSSIDKDTLFLLLLQEEIGQRGVSDGYDVKIESPSETTARWFQTETSTREEENGSASPRQFEFRIMVSTETITETR